MRYGEVEERRSEDRRGKQKNSLCSLHKSSVQTASVTPGKSIVHIGVANSGLLTCLLLHGIHCCITTYLKTLQLKFKNIPYLLFVWFNT